MSPAILLAATVLGLLTPPLGKNPNVTACWAWLNSLRVANRRVIVPEITDYEVRRELIRLGAHRRVREFDSIAARTRYLPITTAAMRRAAELWAYARRIGLPTAGDKTIDADMIRIAQAELLGVPFVIAAPNVGHLARFAPAGRWDRTPA